MSGSAPPPPRPARRLAPRPADRPRLRFRRGRKFPRAIAWFGLTSFWGHLQHFVASAIATEDIDARDWMRADDPSQLLRAVAAELGGDAAAATLTEALGRDVWIDFLADTGDDAEISEAVAELLASTYLAPDPAGDGTLTLPRGDLLLFGGDTAYPVATEREIHNRVIVPYNRVLRGAHDGKPRVLLGVPGNHDWYDGLDGFGRLFRRWQGTIDRRSVVLTDRPDRFGQLGHIVEWAEAFRVGRFVSKRPALILEGYTPVQNASYWALPLAPGLDAWGPDRQLRSVDVVQQLYFAHVRDEGPSRAVLVVLSDPAFAFLEPNPVGLEMLEALGLSVRADRLLCVAGDTHHYVRQSVGLSTHVTAGGGGAFLHPARIPRRGVTPPEAEFPGPRASAALCLQVPFQVAHGRSGFLVHLALAAVFFPSLGSALLGTPAATHAMSAMAGVLVAVVCISIGGWRNPRFWQVAGLGALTGLAAAATPPLVRWMVDGAMGLVDAALPPLLWAFFAYALAIYTGALAFGAFLASLTVLGLEHTQALTSLGHPGYKHFLRLRVRADGSAVDVWAIGKVDPLSREEPVLADAFTFRAR